MKILTLLYIFILCFHLSAWAQENETASVKQIKKAEKLFQKGVKQKAWDEEKHSIYQDRIAEAAFRYYKEAADMGHAEANYRVAVHYEHGKGTVQNLDLMLAYFKRAADLGYREAAYWYASKLETIPGLTLSKVKEITRYYEMSINEGRGFKKGTGLSRTVVINRLGIYYLNYLLDYNKAYNLLKEVESKNVTSADGLNCKVNLAWCYYWGRGCEKDVNKGFALFSEAWQSLKDPLAGSHLAYSYCEGYGTGQDTDKAWSILNQISDDQLSELGHFVKGNLYFYGKGTSVNYDKARQQFVLSADGGYEPAKKMLSDFNAKKAKVK